MKILIVDDEKQLTRALSAIMKKYGMDCSCAYDGEEAYEYARTGLFDVIVLDWMLPLMDGTEVLAKLRKDGISTPVIMLTAKSQISDKLKGFGVGADDYLTKPFDTEELVARIKALSRRSGVYMGNSVTFGNTELDCDAHVLKCGSQSVNLGAKEFALLEMLMKGVGRVFAKEMIIEKIWGYDSEAEYNNVEVYVSFLRRKLASVGSDITLKSIRGAGYCIEVNK